VTLRLGKSYWLDAFRGAGPRMPALRGRHETDIAIIGGGVTGCAVAYFFAKAGARVTLLEHRRIGRGSTSASTALLMQEPDVDFHDLAERYGRAVARRVWHVSRSAVDDMQRTFRSLATPHLHRLPSVYVAHNPSVARTLRRELTARRHAGLAGRWLTAERLKEIAGLDAPGAILTAGNASVDPYRATLRLARAARANGARLFERSKARRIDASSGRVRIELSRGSLEADRVIIATGYATPEFKPLAGRFRLMQTYVFSTPRLSADARRTLGLGDVMVWDSERPYHYARWTPDGRLMFGGHDRPRTARRIRRSQLRRRIRQLWDKATEWYPALDDTKPEYGWEGLFAITPDGLPYIGAHRRYPRHLFALGYGGNGMSFGFLAGQFLVRMARGETGADLDLFRFDRTRRA
jgi:glycine/D-amino acid oxidase-like deaminating enzyme